MYELEYIQMKPVLLVFDWTREYISCFDLDNSLLVVTNLLHYALIGRRDVQKKKKKKVIGYWRI